MSAAAPRPRERGWYNGFKFPANLEAEIAKELLSYRYPPIKTPKMIRTLCIAALAACAAAQSISDIDAEISRLNALRQQATVRRNAENPKLVTADDNLVKLRAFGGRGPPFRVFLGAGPPSSCPPCAHAQPCCSPAPGRPASAQWRLNVSCIML